MKKLLIIATSSLILTSCLKDKEYDNGEIGHQVDDQKIIELVRPNSTSGTRGLALDFKNKDTVISIIPARISSATPAASDITVTLDSTVTSAYVINNAGYTHFKSTLGSIVTPLALTIPKGSFESQPIQIKLNTSNFDPSSKYVIGFKIKSVSDGSYQINANYNTYYVILSAKNAWDGVYINNGTYSDVTNPAFSTGGEMQYSLITAGADKCIVWNDDLNAGAPGYFFFTGTGYSYFGSYGLVIKFDPATNKVVDLWNYYGDPSMAATFVGTPSTGTGAPLYAASNTRRAILDPSGINAVQPNKDIKIKHILVQPSSVPAPPNYRGFFNETWSYVGPR